MNNQDKNQLSSKYDPQIAESKWYKIWEDGGYFKPETQKLPNDCETFSIVIPPPNVTGSLHIGHALNHTLQDVLTRYHRKKGHKTLWLPGTDHAGIATQNVVERLLASEKKTRFDLGREKFEKRVWEWKAESGGTIVNQQRKLGESVDWTRERFTLDEGLNDAVKDVFIRLYEKKLIYRGSRIINWSPKGNTALSDIEVEHEQKNGKLYYFNYPIKDSKELLTIATTRPETMLGDSAVAVHPEDERYTHLKGKSVILPLMDREIPIVFDDYVQKNFGSGVVKITPAHDFNDFELGNRHNLEAVLIMNEKAFINENGGSYEGLYRYDAREKIVSDMKALDLLVKIEDHPHMVGHCYRTHDEVEPMLSKQWFVDIKPIAKKAIEVVENGRIKIIPKQWEKTYFEWMYNIRDWCISRQLWWGHRIPAYYCDKCSHTHVAKEMPKKCEKCGHEKLSQETDVLDTWFSSGLWPFSTLGWPEQSQDLKDFYPTSVLITGFDIIFFWVARMIMMGMEFMDEVPFREVFIHGLVRDENRQKFSKSKGNVVDPLIMMEKYGTDAFRFFLMATLPEGKDIVFNESRLEGYRAFCNKIWNSSRFILMNLPENFSLEKAKEQTLLAAKEGKLELSSIWILNKLNETIAGSEKALAAYRFSEYATLIYDFFWKDFCDWSLELSKPQVFGNDGEEAKLNVLNLLAFVLHEALQLLHPLMPFITEEITQKLGGTKSIISEWPKHILLEEKTKTNATSLLGLLQELVRTVRTIRTSMAIAPGVQLVLTIADYSKEVQTLCDENIQENMAREIKKLAKLSSIRLIKDYEANDLDSTATFSAAKIFIAKPESKDDGKEKEKLEKLLEKTQKNLDSTLKKLANTNFIEKAKPEVVAKENEKKDKLQNEVNQLSDALKLKK